METLLSINLISSDPQVRGGRPCVVGTGLRVSDIALAHLLRRQSPDEIAAGFGVAVAAVYAALAYYYKHKGEIDDDLRQQIATARGLKERWQADGGTSLPH